MKVIIEWPVLVESNKTDLIKWVEWDLPFIPRKDEWIDMDAFFDFNEEDGVFWEKGMTSEKFRKIADFGQSTRKIREIHWRKGNIRSYNPNIFYEASVVLDDYCKISEDDRFELVLWIFLEKSE